MHRRVAVVVIPIIIIGVLTVPGRMRPRQNCEQKLLASQYSRNGNYHIEEHTAEVLPDGRVIIGKMIFDGFIGENNFDSYIGMDLVY